LSRPASGTRASGEFDAVAAGDLIIWAIAPGGQDVEAQSSFAYVHGSRSIFAPCMFIQIAFGERAECAAFGFGAPAAVGLRP
jgi:hypothetical protein